PARARSFHLCLWDFFGWPGSGGHRYFSTFHLSPNCLRHTLLPWLPPSSTGLSGGPPVKNATVKRLVVVALIFSLFGWLMTTIEPTRGASSGSSVHGLSNQAFACARPLTSI